MEPRGGTRRIPCQSVLLVDGRHLRSRGAWGWATEALAPYPDNLAPRLAALDEAPSAHSGDHSRNWREAPPQNVWYGTSVESADYLWRIDAFRAVPAVGEVPLGGASTRPHPQPSPRRHRLGDHRRGV